MHTIINRIRSSREIPHSSHGYFSRPRFDCDEDPGSVRLIIYLPEVDDRDVEICLQGRRLVVTARRRRVVRTNWSTLQLENFQPDYRLSVRLGRGIDVHGMRAEIEDRVLTLHLPKVLNHGPPLVSVA